MLRLFTAPEINHQLVIVTSGELASCGLEIPTIWQNERNLENPGAQASVASSLVTRMDCCGELMP